MLEHNVNLLVALLIKRNELIALHILLIARHNNHRIRSSPLNAHRLILNPLLSGLEPVHHLTANRSLLLVPLRDLLPLGFLARKPLVFLLQPHYHLVLLRHRGISLDELFADPLKLAQLPPRLLSFLPEQPHLLP